MAKKFLVIDGDAVTDKVSACFCAKRVTRSMRQEMRLRLSTC